MSSILVTGADGYLGSRIARRLLEEGEERVLLWVHGRVGSVPPSKRDHLAHAFAGFENRIDVHAGDLADEEPFASVEPRAVGAVVHAAAVTRFGVDAATARRVNVDGTARALAFARRCPRLGGFALLSSIYASGLRGGEIAEGPLDQGAFANEYERSKQAAEALVMAERVPWQVFRIATVIADGDLGRVVQHNAFHNTLKLLYHGFVSTVPGVAGTPLYFVTGDFVASSVARLLHRGGTNRIWHVSHERADAVTLGRLLDVVFEVFRRSEPFRRRGVLKPLLMDEVAFTLLREAVDRFAGPVVKEAVESIAPFARQLYVDKDVRNDGLRASLGEGYGRFDAEGVVERTCHELVRTRFARENALASH